MLENGLFYIQIKSFFLDKFQKWFKIWQKLISNFFPKASKVVLCKKKVFLFACNHDDDEFNLKKERERERG